MPPFSEADLTEDPLDLFASWFSRAGEELPLSEAVCLASVDADGDPDARMVLLKGFGPDGFRFFTNRDSVKGGQLADRPVAALVFFWRELDRQIRVRGSVERLPESDSDEYFASRPPESRVGAWASPQSRPLADRAELDARVAEIEERFADGEVPRPEFWGGYRVIPRSIEFWQGQVGRLHDRFVYTREEPGGEGSGWAVTRLAP